MYMHFGLWHDMYDQLSPPYHSTINSIANMSKLDKSTFMFFMMSLFELVESVCTRVLVVLCETWLRATGMLLGGQAVRCGAWPKRPHRLVRTSSADRQRGPREHTV